ncbi:cytochrome c biogenesis heme-transporting ATPase CcmA [Candidatus Marithrix sp. Canyon 246]|uniref:cytochrome c biogenesis heme-transporting ATPase CcmA n=1 Tax=Candidatus Marithrix sp. Canyon 246 TaxID=1827136 RepID=UPI000849FE8D|nr:cytochrome c biogenesis heme-transporting ATPase CcmA [Candidatus Marithrix sp. Canyon 246]
MKNTLKIENLQCIRDDRILFENLNFTLSNGQLLQIEGNNGCGKTSLLRILCGISLSEEGLVFWNNENIEEIKSTYYTNLIYIGHHNGVKRELTPLENLAIARALASNPSSIELEEALDKVGLYGFEDVATGTLSAGQQRRVALARLFINKAPLWILDEPFTALDKTAVADLEKLLDDHAKQGGMAILTSHHHIKCEYLNSLHLS